MKGEKAASARLTANVKVTLADPNENKLPPWHIFARFDFLPGIRRSNSS
jgi:hypothetical protein